MRTHFVVISTERTTPHATLTDLQDPISYPEPAVLVGGASVMHGLDVDHLAVVVGGDVSGGQAEAEPLGPSLDGDGVTDADLPGVGAGQGGGLRGRCGGR